MRPVEQLRWCDEREWDAVGCLLSDQLEFGICPRRQDYGPDDYGCPPACWFGVCIGLCEGPTGSGATTQLTRCLAGWMAGDMVMVRDVGGHNWCAPALLWCVALLAMLLLLCCCVVVLLCCCVVVVLLILLLISCCVVIVLLILLLILLLISCCVVIVLLILLLILCCVVIAVVVIAVAAESCSPALQL